MSAGAAWFHPQAPTLVSTRMNCSSGFSSKLLIQASELDAKASKASFVSMSRYIPDRSEA